MSSPLFDGGFDCSNKRRYTRRPGSTCSWLKEKETDAAIASSEWDALPGALAGGFIQPRDGAR